MPARTLAGLKQIAIHGFPALRLLERGHMDLRDFQTRALQAIEGVRRSLEPKAKSARVAVIGDMAVDRFVFGNVDRISPEAPVPVLLVEKSEDKAGCAANVVRNLHQLGQDVDFENHLYGVVGQDEGSLRLQAILEEDCSSVQTHLHLEKNWQTPIKSRYIAGSQHQLLRVDQEKSFSIAKRGIDFPLDWKNSLPESSVIICQDYRKGLLENDFLQEIIRLGKKFSRPVFVDPNRNTPPAWYAGATLLTPNLEEAEILYGKTLERGQNEDLVVEAAQVIMERYDLESILITRGKHGMTGRSRGGNGFSFPSFAREVFDVTGAGDTVIATLGLFCALGYDLPTSAYIANAAASVVVSKVGTAVASLQEIQLTIRNLKSV